MSPDVNLDRRNGLGLVHVIDESERMSETQLSRRYKKKTPIPTTGHRIEEAHIHRSNKRELDSPSRMDAAQQAITPNEDLQMLMSVEGARLQNNRVKLETIVDAARTNDSATLTAIPKASS